MGDEERKSKDTTDGNPPHDDHWDAAAPQPVNPKTGQHGAYWVLSAAERAKGFVRPVRLKYVHEVCGTVTSMAQSIAETYARDPAYYGSTFCVGCRDHFPVGAEGKFVWDGTSEKVGT